MEYNVQSVEKAITNPLPTVVGVAYSFSNLPWDKMAAAATFFYVLIQAYFFLKAKWHIRKRKQQVRRHFRRKYKVKPDDQS